MSLKPHVGLYNLLSLICTFFQHVYKTCQRHQSGALSVQKDNRVGRQRGKSVLFRLMDNGSTTTQVHYSTGCRQFFLVQTILMNHCSLLRVLQYLPLFSVLHFTDVILKSKHFIFLYLFLFMSLWQEEGQKHRIGSDLSSFRVEGG